MSLIASSNMCFRCRGACCEEFILPLDAIEVRRDADAKRWFQLHGSLLIGPRIHFECKCTQLTDEGKCSIYETRPDVCKVLEPGSEACLNVVRRRRTEVEYEYIKTGAYADDKARA